MSETLLLQWMMDEPEKAHWQLIDKKGTPVGETATGQLSELAAAAKGRRVMLIAPGEALLLTTASVPSGSARTIAKALPYAVEEQLADDIEDLIIVQGPRDGDAPVPVAIVRSEQLDTWLKQLNESGIKPDWVIPEPLLLPLLENEWSIVADFNRVVLRHGLYTGLACTPQQFQMLLPRLLREAPDQAIPRVRLWGGEQATEVGEALERAGCPIEPMNESGLQAFGDIPQKRHPMDLLQGYIQRDQNNVPNAGNWWPAVALLLLALCVHLGTSGYRYWQLEAQHKQLTQQTEALFKSTFPEVKRLVDPLVQARQQLEKRQKHTGQGSDTLLDLLYRIGQVGQAQKGIAFTGMEFRQRVLNLQLTAKSVAEIEQFKQQLEAVGGVEVEIVSAVTKDSQIATRIKIKERAS